MCGHDWKSILQRSASLVLIVVALAIPASLDAQENVVIVLDDSGSMNEPMSSGNTRIEAAKTAITAVLKQFQQETKLGLLLLNGGRSNEHWAIPLEPLSASKATKLVMTLRANGGTPLGDRIREGADALLKLREKQVYGNYRLLVVTDGEANDARLLATYLPDILSRGIIVDAIGVDMKKDHTLATRVHSYRRADDDAALQKALQEVFAERLETAGGASAKDDYELLNALDSETAKQALLALSKPNNLPIVGVTQPNTWSVAPSASVNVLGSIVVGMLACITPVVLLVVLLAIFVSKSKSKSNRKQNW
jgi:hypothetical protein